MSKINELYVKYANLDVSKFDYKLTEDLRNALKDVKDSELQGIEEHKQYLALLHRFRVVVKKFTDLNGENYLKTIRELLSVGSSGMYSSELRFLYELIQNVDDCEYDEPLNARLNIKCDFNNGTMTFEYNEKGFSPFNVFAITGIAEQAKNFDPNKVEIGEKGLGFKTVFGVARTVFIQSGYFSFKLTEDDFTCPISDYENFEPVDGTKLTLYMEPKKVYQIFYAFMAKYKSHDSLLCNNPLLFLNKLSELRVYFDNYRSLKFTVERRFDLNALSEFKKAEHIKLTYEDGKDIHEELTCTHYVMPITYNRDACISRYGKNTAFSSKKMNMQVIVPDLEYVKGKNAIKRGSFYSFLPTKVEIPVPIVCHIPFKLDPSREHVDSQNGNKWFVYSCQIFSDMFDKVLKDLAQMYKEDIVHYLLKKSEFLFVSDKEYANLDLPYFKGEHFLELPLFYTKTGGFLPADKVFAFLEPEKLQSTVRVAEILNYNKHLFNTTEISITGFNIEAIKDVTDRLFRIAFLKSEYAKEIFSILSDYEGFSFDEKIKELVIELNAEIISAIFAVDKCLRAFKNVARNCLNSDGRPKFNFSCDKERIIDVRHVDLALDIELDDFGDATKKYLSWIGYSCIISDSIPAGEFFITQNVLILSKDDTIAALSSFCRVLDPRHAFAATLDLRRCSKRLDEVDDSISAVDYLKELRTIRKSIRNAFGSDVYNNYINIINQAGTSPERYINELLQNADDCEYSSDVTPKFQLKVSQDLKVIGTKYNEKGFTKGNVRAITAIGESTKRKLMQGAKDENSIGEKGVGFKSVFAVANKVEIYSGGFNFSLSESAPTIPNPLQPKKGCETGTTMLFHLKEEVKLDFFSEEKILSLCLCLRKLKEIWIDAFHVKINDENGIRKIQVNDNEYEYKKFAYEFIVDDDTALNERRDNKWSISREQQILIYIPLNKKSVIKTSYLYSGLPTGIQINVPLIIDAPFELNTARTDVIENKWNNYVLRRLYAALKAVLLELSKIDGIDVLRFIKTRRESNGYVIDLFSNTYLNRNEFLTTLKSIDILPTLKDNYFVSANKYELYRIPEIISETLENVNDLGVDLSCYLKYSDKYDETLNALGVKKLQLDKTIDLIKKVYLDKIHNEEFSKSLYKYLEEQKPMIYSVRDILKTLKIIPVKGLKEGQTEYLSWNECASNLYVKDLAAVSTDMCWILRTDMLEKSLCESFFGTSINEFTSELEEYTYSKKLLNKFEESMRDEELYNYLLGEFINNYRLFSKCQDVLIARKHLIPLKNQLGKLKRGKICVSKTEVGYFSGKLLPSHVAHKECERFAEFIRCVNIADIFHDDLDINIELSAEDIEDLKDDYINNGYEILAYCVKNGFVSSELIKRYGLEKLSDITVEYDEDVFNQPIDDIERFYKKIQERIENPIRIEPKEVKKMIRVGITNKGEEVSIDSDDRRRYNARKYALKSGHCVCQMCKKAKLLKYIEVNNIEKLPKFYWEECGIVLCLECSKRFEELRDDEKLLERFHRDIIQANINSNQPIEIPIANQIITFSQRHLAEIQEILKKQDSIS